MSDGEMCLNCSLSPENPSWAYRCGVFFDVVNKTDRTIFLTGLTAGAYGGDREATLYACTAGESAGHETFEAEWKVLWSGVLKKRASSPLSLCVLLKLPPHATQGLLLVSKSYAVYHTTQETPVEDDNIRICAGVRSTEHRGDMNPFDPAAHSRHEKATHAGSISYIFGKSYIVMCYASEPDDDRLTHITCRNMAGRELAILAVQPSENVAKLREGIGAVLSSELSDAAALQLELMTPGCTLLSDEATIEDALLGKQGQIGGDSPVEQAEGQ